ncbi:hypothetical protein PVL29_012767 [Vitis rotundifolia]|uniref:LysM domain-containing protein n=1 Tax=Vitis rotundifolia TaxID=103349 RepID=A0AA38ZJK9_VITRO|nr:hypothetical protein PVL29_012767 [Vitis rotundifolia]
MAKANSKSLNLIFMLSLLILVSMAESRFLGFGTAAKKATPQCDTVVGVESGDTCFDIAEKFQLTTEFFDSINPNLNCDALFVGQWVCVDGTVN